MAEPSLVEDPSTDWQLWGKLNLTTSIFSSTEWWSTCKKFNLYPRFKREQTQTVQSRQLGGKTVEGLIQFLKRQTQHVIPSQLFGLWIIFVIQCNYRLLHKTVLYIQISFVPYIAQNPRDVYLIRAAWKLSFPGTTWDHIGPPGTSGDHQGLLKTLRDHSGPSRSTRDSQRSLGITWDRRDHPSPLTGQPETIRDHLSWPPWTTRDNRRQLGFGAKISYCIKLFCAIIFDAQNRFCAVNTSLKDIVSCIAPLVTLTFVIYVCSSFIEHFSITFLSPGSRVICLKTCWPHQLYNYLEAIDIFGDSTNKIGLLSLLYVWLRLGIQMKIVIG